MKIDLAGRTGLVTGSTQGIGAAIAQGLARAGARVVHLGSPLASATTGGAVRVDDGYVDAILP